MSQIQCPFCNHANSGSIPFCSECGRVLPMGDEAQIGRASCRERV